MKRILIVKLWASGDILMATPLLQALRRDAPGIYIAWAADIGHAGILQGHPLIDELISIDTGRWRRFLRNGNLPAWISESRFRNREMQRQRFDAVINCHPDQWWTRLLCPAPVRVALYPSPKMPPTKHLYTHSVARPNQPAIHNTDYYLRAALALGLLAPFDRHMSLSVSADDQRRAQAFLRSENDFRPDLPLILLHPGTSQPSKCWPPEQFAAVATALLPANNVVLTGSPREQPLAAAILAALPRDLPKPLIAIGRLDGIGATAALVRQAAVVVTGDTVMLHMASALETPLVGIFGSTRPGDNLPLYGPHVLLYDDAVPCAPCYKEHCPLTGNQRLQCQRAVTPEQVLSALRQLSAEKTARKEN